MCFQTRRVRTLNFTVSTRHRGFDKRTEDLEAFKKQSRGAKLSNLCT